MSVSYAKYSAMSDEQLQKAIADRRVTPEYLGWLGIIGPGKTLRETINASEKTRRADHRRHR